MAYEQILTKNSGVSTEPNQGLTNNQKENARNNIDAAAIRHTHTTSDISGLASVATSGNYNDLSNKPDISNKADTSYVDAHDNNLQSQIDTITSQSDVTDVVGTYAALLAYSKQLYVDDIIKVLADENNNGAISHYRYKGGATSSSSSWTLIGSIGPFYTKSETDTKLNGKANSTHTHTASQVSGLSTVATSGSYTDLSNKPSIPAAVTESTVSGWGFTKNTGTVTVSGTATSGQVVVSNGGNVIKTTGYTIAKSVPSDAVFTDTTYNEATTSSSGLMSSSDKTKLNGIATGAQVNQNAFSNIKVGTTTIAADSTQDTVTFIAGANITLTPDATNDQITISATSGSSGSSTIFRNWSA